MGVLGYPEKGKLSLRRERSPAVQAAHPPHDTKCVPSMEVRCPHRRPEAVCIAIQVSSLATDAPWNVSGGRFTRIWVFRSLPTTSDP
jgi:hypothetical protein